MKVLYDYEAQDLDELTIKEGELIDLVKEGQFLKNLLILLIDQLSKKVSFLAICSPPSDSFFLR